MEEGMDLRKCLFIMSMFMTALLFAVPGVVPDIAAAEPIFVTGVVKSVADDFTSIVMKDDIKIGVSSDTKLLDEKGNPLNLNKLKPGLYLSVEASETAGGLTAKKIALRKKKGV
jgi:hypothetical protein